MSGQSHTSDARVLDRRTLERDHRRLADALRPGMKVLDVGCGTGAITAGIARAVGPKGYVLGIDRDIALLDLAQMRYCGVSNLEFRAQDILMLALERRFDIVTASRALQWVDQPNLAVARMKSAAKSGGLVIALDYNHTQNSWEPSPPQEFQAFYHAFLEWRAANNWDNGMGDRLPAIFEQAGLSQIMVYVEDEITTRGEPGFSDVATLWGHVIETLGPKITAAGYLSEADRMEVGRIYEAWCSQELKRQTLVLRAIAGRVP